jgi:hypothetical protein
MWAYEIVREYVPEPLTDLGQPSVDGPHPHDVPRMSFPNAQIDPRTAAEALGVGQPCRVIRRSDGRAEECGGALLSLSPVVVVSLHGGAWTDVSGAARAQES